MKENGNNLHFPKILYVWSNGNEKGSDVQITHTISNLNNLRVRDSAAEELI